MINRKIITLAFCLTILLGSIAGILFYNEWDGPDRYRSNHSWPNLIYYLKTLGNPPHSSFTTKGLDRYNVIGTARLNFQHFQDTVKDWKGKVNIFNGRHTAYYYYHGKELQTYCLDIVEGQVTDVGHKRFLGKLQCRINRWKDGVNTLPQMNELKTEEQLLKEMGFELVYPLSPNWIEDWSFVDSLITLFENTPKKDLIYFHCDHGKGRTTTFMALLDVFHNARDLTINEIITRQYVLGGVDLFDLKPWKNSTWSAKYLETRLNIIHTFYV